MGKSGQQIHQDEMATKNDSPIYRHLRLFDFSAIRKFEPMGLLPTVAVLGALAPKTPVDVDRINDFFLGFASQGSPKNWNKKHRRILIILQSPMVHPRNLIDSHGGFNGFSIGKITKITFNKAHVFGEASRFGDADSSNEVFGEISALEFFFSTMLAA